MGGGGEGSGRAGPDGVRPFRVLAVLPTLSSSGGAERSFVATAPGLIAQGVELHLALVQGLGELAPAAVDAGVVVHDLSQHTSELGRARALRTLIRRLAPDLVHATLYDAATPAQLAVLGTKTPILITWANVRIGSRAGHDTLVSRWKVQAVGVVETLLGWASASRYHAVTSGVASTNAPAFHVRPARVKVAERGRDPEVFRPIPRVELDRLRSELGLEPTDRVVLAIGRQEPQKGYPSLIGAFDSVVDRRPDAMLLIAGREGRDTPMVTRRLAESRHPDRIRLLGQRDDVPALLQVAEIVVCASHAEGAAGSLIEAMASERAVVTVPIAGLVGVFRPDVDALVVEREGLACAVVELLDDPERMTRLARSGREVFERRFTADRSVASLASVYRWAAS